MRGVSVNQDRFKGHPVVALHAEACSVDSELSTVDTKPHPAINIHPNASESIEELSVAEFIADIESKGSPDNRYNSFGVNFNSGYLFALDSFVFGLRQQIGVPPIQEVLRKMDQGLVETFNLYNPWFAPVQLDLAEIPNKEFNLRISDSVTTLDILTGSHAPNKSPKPTPTRTDFTSKAVAARLSSPLATYSEDSEIYLKVTMHFVPAPWVFLAKKNAGKCNFSQKFRYNNFSYLMGSYLEAVFVFFTCLDNCKLLTYFLFK